MCKKWNLKIYTYIRKIFIAILLLHINIWRTPVFIIRAGMPMYAHTVLNIIWSTIYFRTIAYTKTLCGCASEFQIELIGKAVACYTDR